jgi:hypothetical protein
VAATAARRPRRTVDELRFPQNLLLSKVARWQELGSGARRFTFGSGADSEFYGEVVRTRFSLTPDELSQSGNRPKTCFEEVGQVGNDKSKGCM